MGERSQTPLLAGHPISRRGFLARSAWLSAALGAGSFACGRTDAGYEALLPANERPVQLPVREYVVLRAVCDRMVPPSGGQPGALTLGVPARIDHELSFHESKLRSDITAALQLVEWWPLVTRGTRFTRLDAAAQDQLIADMATSRLAERRTAFQGLKFVAMFLTYTQEPTWSAIGYDGPWVPRGLPAAPA